MSRGRAWKSPYRLDSENISVKDGQLQGVILKDVGEGLQAIRLPLVITFLRNGVARVVIDEEKRQKGDIELRHGSQARKERYSEVSDWTIVGGLDPNKNIEAQFGAVSTFVLYGPRKQYTAFIRHSPFSIDFSRGDQAHVKLNGNGLMNFEHWRPKVEKERNEGDEGEQGITDNAEDESTWWDEQFGGNTDSKPKGPESVGLDITFPGYEHVFGIPGHASSLSLKETRYAHLICSINFTYPV